MVAVLCALGASLCYALASVLQQRSAAAESEEHSLKLGLLTRLLRNRMWLLGAMADVVGFVFQFIALSIGTLVLVQPLLVCGLLFALPVGARFNGKRIHKRDVASAGVVVIGLGVFQWVANPAAGHDFIAPKVWLALLTAGGGAGVILSGAAQRTAGRTKAVLLSAGAGVIYGVAAALVKTTGKLLSIGIVPLVTHWELYALIVVGLVGMLVSQSAFQAGSLEISLPTMSVVDPLASILIGALAFGERIVNTPGDLALEVISLLVMVIGVFALSQSPAISQRGAALPPPPP